MTRRRDRCEHEFQDRVWRVGGGDAKAWFDAASWEVADMIVCFKCGHTLTRGPSNDSDPRVEIEIDAAYVASRWPDSQAYWLAVEAMSATDGRNQEVIGLARVIAEHGEQGER